MDTNRRLFCIDNIVQMNSGQPQGPKIGLTCLKMPKNPFFGAISKIHLFLASKVEQMAPGWPQVPKLDPKCQEMPQKWPKNHIFSFGGTYMGSKSKKNVEIVSETYTSKGNFGQ